jgi:hypothetical protein
MKWKSVIPAISLMVPYFAVIVIAGYWTGSTVELAFIAFLLAAIGILVAEMVYKA